MSVYSRSRTRRWHTVLLSPCKLPLPLRARLLQAEGVTGGRLSPSREMYVCKRDAPASRCSQSAMCQALVRRVPYAGKNGITLFKESKFSDHLAIRGRKESYITQMGSAWTITDGHGCTATVVEHGASLARLCVPDRHGAVDDIVLGLDDDDGYRANPHYLGSVVGRCANRIGGARYTHAGKEHVLDANDGENALHGSHKDGSAWSHCRWTLDSHDEASVAMSYVSADGQGGYPGEARARVEYRFVGPSRLRVRMTCETTAPCPVNMVQHAFYNLAGHASAKLSWNHHLAANATHYTPVGPSRVPTGEIHEVKGTHLDFTRPTLLADRQAQAEPAGGYDHNFVIRTREDVERDPDALVLAAELWEASTGRALAVYSNQPGMQLYTSGFLSGDAGKDGATYARFAGVCLETQAWPDAVHHAHFPSIILEPGQRYVHEMELRFSTFTGPVDQVARAPKTL